MSEAELHILRARLDGGIRNKAARGELYRRLPPGYVRGDSDAEILFDPDEQVQGAIRAVFARFAEFGSVRRVWRWFDREKLDFPVRMPGEQIRWGPPSYGMIGKYKIPRGQSSRHRRSNARTSTSNDGSRFNPEEGLAA